MQVESYSISPFVTLTSLSIMSSRFTHVVHGSEPPSFMRLSDRPHFVHPFIYLGLYLLAVVSSAAENISVPVLV